MAHNLELTGDGNASFAYSAEHGDPWHRLGTPVDGLSTVTEILVAARADFEVHKTKLATPDPTGGDRLLDTGKSYTWRNRPIWIDAETDELRGGEPHVLGIVGDDYPVIQNGDVAHLGRRLIDALPGDRIVDCAGVLDDGRRFFMTIPLDDVVLDPNGVADRHTRNLVLTTGHNGRYALQAVHGVTRAVCENTVQAALQYSDWCVSIRHVGTFDPDVVELRPMLGLAERGGARFEEVATTLLSVPAGFDDVVKVHDKLWSPETPEMSDRAVSLRSGRLQTLSELWSSETNVGAVGANRWAALMTFSEYFEHRQSFAGMKSSGARSERATATAGSLHDNVHKTSRILQTL